MLLAPFLIICLATVFGPSSCQRYAERNVLPAPSSPDVPASYDSDDYDYEEGDPYGFQEEEEPNVYKWNVDQYPHPVNTPRFCNRLKASHVCDPDIVLDREQADSLDDSIQKLYRETPCICDTCEGSEEGGGIVVGIALLKHLHHPYHMHPAKVIRSFAESLRVRWKLGRCDNDILIVVATTDRLSYTDVGSATSAHLSIQEAHRIFLENRAKFSASNFSEGLSDIIQGYRRVTKGMRREGTGGRGDVDMTLVTGAIIGSVLLLGVLLFVGFVVYRRCRNRKEVEEKDREPERGTGATVSSSWSKKDIKVLFGPEKSSTSAKYQRCGTDENNAGGDTKEAEEEEMNFTLAMPDDTSFPNQTQLTNVTSESETLEKELTAATEGLVKTFPSRNIGSVLVTDM